VVTCFDPATIQPYVSTSIELSLDNEARTSILTKLDAANASALAPLLNAYGYYDIRDLVRGADTTEMQSVKDYIQGHKPALLRKLEKEGHVYASADYAHYALDQLGGLDDVIAHARRLLIEPFLDMTAYRSHNIDMPRGLLLCGPPGTGKTHLALALAKDSPLAMLHVHAANLRSKYLGESEKRVAAAFRQARSLAPCILLLDHVETLLPRRHDGTGVEGGAGGGGDGGGEDRLVTAFLTEMDGFLRQEGVVVVAVAERRDRVDPAVLRPGRLGVCLDLGVVLDRAEPVLEKVLASVSHELPGGFVGELLKRLPARISPSDIKGIVERAGRRAVQAGRGMILPEDFPTVIDKVAAPCFAR
jgi:transitional endoplasmic reticulum ATPase